MKKLLHVTSHLIFWSWNFVFLGLMYLWLLPQTGFWLWEEARAGLIEPTFVASFLALMIVPLVCTLLGFIRLRKHPALLLRLFYGVEAPLFALCLMRLFVLRELTLASGFTLALVITAIAMYAIELLTGYAAYRPRLANVQMAAHSLILLVGTFLGTILTLYTLPTLVVGFFGVLIAFFSFQWVPALFEAIASTLRYSSLEGLIFGPLFGFLGLSSVLVFMSMPYLFSLFYIGAWDRIFVAFAKQYGDRKAWAITGSTLALVLTLFIGLQGQSQVKAFNLLAATPTDTTSLVEGSPTGNATPTYQLPTDTKTRQAQLAETDAIKTGLTNAYLHRYRYLSPWENSNALTSFYQDVLSVPEGGAQFFQRIHNALVSPFLYRGADSDAEKAADLYAQFFDVSIQEDQRSPILRALQATASREDTSAGLLNQDQEIIRLASQSVTVTEKGDWASVEIHERYENDTPENQEIFYSFSLPESAAITGLWLGDGDNPKQYPFVVSPRGAAQQVYNGEVERAQVQTPVDPALLEQVGPRQYRLRVFPIPNALWQVSTDTENLANNLGRRRQRKSGELELWMTYDVMQQGGQWPLPQLTEKRSIFWTERTQRLRNGQALTKHADTWFEAAIPAQTTAKAQAHTAALPTGYTVTATPIAQPNKHNLASQRLAVIVDSSYSMGQQKSAIAAALNQLKSVSTQNTLDFYVPAAGTHANQSEHIAVKDILFYGSLQPADMLQQFTAAQANNAPGDSEYDAIILLTDQGNYELSKGVAPPSLSAPLWIVHLGDKLPSAYDDEVLQLLKATKGGTTTSMAQALQQVAAAANGEAALDGYVWNVTAPEAVSAGAEALAGAEVPTTDEPDTTQNRTPAPSPATPTRGFETIAARQVIAQQSRTLDLTQVTALDQVHEIAKSESIVTPYSSMLVLVDERQKELLKEAEASDNRFEREVEDGQDGLANPNNPLEAASIPEPGQVLGLLCCALALVFLKRNSLVPGRPRI